jgi:uncharacterized protein YgbK (DUF1537 family)
MQRRWLVVADDLTGAADCAIAFSRRRLSARVIWGNARPVQHPAVFALAFNADTRGMGPAEAARHHAESIRGVDDAEVGIYKKIDSTLRGHFACEIAAMLVELKTRTPRRLAVFAPAYPAQGRTTVNGHVSVRGVPLEHGEFWPAGRDAAEARIPAQLENAGVRARLIPLEIVRGTGATLRSALRAAADADPDAVLVCDAETDADLDALAAAAMRTDPRAFFIGSAGLAHALARMVPLASEERAPLRVQRHMRGTLIVVGSQAAASRAAAASLAHVPGVVRHSVEATSLDGTPAPADEGVMRDLAAALDAGHDVLLDIAPPADPRSVEGRPVIELARRFATVASHAGALVATGGDSAAALLASCGIAGLELIDEIEPGIPLGLTLGELSLPIVTKAGGFGDEGCLRRIVERLRFIRQTGTVA